MEGDTPVKIEHTPGQVMMVDWWATWCPPCQGPMAHNQEMASKNKEAWKDKAQIVCISIDQKMEAIKPHVDKKGWNDLVHYHKAGSDCSK